VSGLDAGRFPLVGEYVRDCECDTVGVVTSEDESGMVGDHDRDCLFGVTVRGIDERGSCGGHDAFAVVLFVSFGS